MKSDVNGCSTCKAGRENWEAFTLRGIGGKPRKAIQYDYRHTNGNLFSCVAPTLEEARARRDKWLEGQGNV
jgi:hypothetical protein